MIFQPLPTVDGGFCCLHADPAYPFSGNSVARPGRNCRRHFRCARSVTEIASLPVKNVVAKDALCFLWITGPHLPEAVRILEAWGFRYSGVAFTWIKLKRSFDPNQLRLLPTLEADLHVGLGYTTRKNAEFVLLGRRGNPERLARDVREVVFAPLREFGRKPDEVYRRIERLCRGPRLDLFPREHHDGWVPYGDEVGKFDRPREADDAA